MMRRVTLFLLFSLFFAVRVSAHGERIMVVSLRNGASASFPLGERPCVCFPDGQMNVVSASTRTEFLFSEVRGIFFVDSSNTAVDDAVGESSVLFNNECLSISGVSCGTLVRIFSADGRCVANKNADAGGCCTYSFANLPGGTYIINFNETTIKYLKK